MHSNLTPSPSSKKAALTPNLSRTKTTNIDNEPFLLKIEILQEELMGVKSERN
jgi:hypothetical protein